MRRKIFALGILILVFVFSLGCSISLVSEEEKEAKMQRIDEKYVLRKLKEKYGEEFVIAGYDPGGWWGGPNYASLRAYPKAKGEEWTFAVKLYQPMEDGYMLLYKYEDYKAYIQSFLEEMYGQDITLEGFKKDDRNVLPNTINKDTKVEEMGPLLIKKGPQWGTGADVGPLTIRVNEKILEDTNISKEAYRIAKAFADHKIDAVFIYISVVKSTEYEHGKTFSKYYTVEMDDEKRLELNKKFFSFFSKHEEIYESPYYSIGTYYDEEKRKFRIYDDELKQEYWID